MYQAYRAFFGTDDKQLLLLLLQMSVLSDRSLLVHIMVVWGDTPKLVFLLSSLLPLVSFAGPNSC